MALLNEQPSRTQSMDVYTIVRFASASTPLSATENISHASREVRLLAASGAEFIMT